MQEILLETANKDGTQILVKNTGDCFSLNLKKGKETRIIGRVVHNGKKLTEFDFLLSCIRYLENFDFGVFENGPKALSDIDFISFYHNQVTNTTFTGISFINGKLIIPKSILDKEIKFKEKKFKKNERLLSEFELKERGYSQEEINSLSKKIVNNKEMKLTNAQHFLI